MTAGSNGTNTPEGDDPFGYLYRSEDGASEGQSQQAGVPRTSYNQVRAVGERRYGHQQRPHDAQSPSAYYAAPEAQPVGPGGAGAPGGPGGGHGGYPGHGGPGGPGGPKRRNGLLIGALAVVAAVVLGVGAAVAFSDDDSGDNANPDPQQSESADPGGDDEDEKPDDEDKPDEEEKPDELPSEDASSLRLDDGPQVGEMVEGSRAKDGGYIAGFTKEGATATWTVNVDKPGPYKLYVGYTVPGEDMSMNVAANEADPYPTRFDNFANAKKGEWKKGWTHTFAEVTAKEGENTFRISCGDDAKKCEVAVDRVWLAEK